MEAGGEVFKIPVNFIGHVCRMHADKWAKIATEWKPASGKRSRCKPRRRCRDDVPGFCPDMGNKAQRIGMVEEDAGRPLPSSGTVQANSLRIDFSRQIEDSTLTTFQDNGLSVRSLKRKIFQFADFFRADKSEKINNVQVENQYGLFQGALKPLLLWGQFWGLNPFTGVLEKDHAKVRFNIYSWRFLHSVIIWIFQIIITALCVRKLYKDSITVGNVAFLAFYGSTCLSTFLFFRVASKWPRLVKEVANSQLDKYVDPRIKWRCNIYFALLLSFSLLEHLLSAISGITEILDCYSRDLNIYEAYIVNEFSLVFELGIHYTIPLAIVLQILVFVCTVNWNYSDIFIISVSFYLSSLLENINEKINETRGRNYPIEFWRALRVDYTRVTRLVRIFDEVASCIIFVSFGTALFFICLQMFELLSEGVRLSKIGECPNYPSGPFGGYERSIYYVVSLAFIFSRFLAVSLVASSVHTASMAAAPALYEVSSEDYNVEIQRFIEQVHGDTVALSGLQFFYITKDLVLTVAGTIVTYELVLLQFRDQDPDPFI